MPTPRDIPMIMGRQALLGMVHSFLAASDDFAMTISICRPATNPANPILVAIQMGPLTFGFTVDQLGQAIDIIDEARDSQEVSEADQRHLGQLLQVLRQAHVHGANTSSHGPN